MYTPPHAPRPRRPYRPKPRLPIKGMALMLAAIWGLTGHLHLNELTEAGSALLTAAAVTADRLTATNTADAAAPIVPPPVPHDVQAKAKTAAPAPKQAFRCQGKTRCTQFRSCAEATFYLNHCGGQRTDGDRDGIPCEDQWCGH